MHLKNRVIPTAVVIIAMPLISLGCSKELTRDEAQKILQDDKALLNIAEGEAFGAYLTLEVVERGDLVKVNPIYGDLAEVLIQKGVLEKHQVGDDAGIRTTEAGEKMVYKKPFAKSSSSLLSLFSGPPTFEWHIPVYKPGNYKVTGIIEESEVDSSAEVQFDWIPNEIGQAAEEFEETNGSLIGKNFLPETGYAIAAFKRYDDGWRLQSFDSKNAIHQSKQPG